jgi:hypothetical protein
LLDVSRSHPKAGEGRLGIQYAHVKSVNLSCFFNLSMLLAQPHKAFELESEEEVPTYYLRYRGYEKPGRV